MDVKATGEKYHPVTYVNQWLLYSVNDELLNQFYKVVIRCKMATEQVLRMIVDAGSRNSHFFRLLCKDTTLRYSIEGTDIHHIKEE